jgi:DNA-directed RNA polymerase specialized sigma subunit
VVEDTRIVRPRKERPADVKREMLAAARGYKRRNRELERAVAKLQKERDAAIAKAVKGGMPVADVGAAFDISQQRVSQIIRAHRRSV